MTHKHALLAKRVHGSILFSTLLVIVKLDVGRVNISVAVARVQPVMRRATPAMELARMLAYHVVHLHRFITMANASALVQQDLLQIPPTGASPVTPRAGRALRQHQVLNASHVPLRQHPSSHTIRQLAAASRFVLMDSTGMLTLEVACCAPVPAPSALALEHAQNVPQG
jgi:hypothetical protein